MAVISITITESERQLIYGVPRSVILTVNIPSTIFYTLDGSEPDTSSDVYVGELELPTTSTVTLKIYATNGSDSSSIITQEYGTALTGRKSYYSSVTGIDTPSNDSVSLFPFSDGGSNFTAIYGDTGLIPVDSPNITNIPDGYDGTGTGTITNGTDLPLTSYQIKYSETNSKGERGHGIGTLPATVTIRATSDVPISSNITSRLFNPKAKVIFIDSRDSEYDPNLVNIIPQSFSLGNPEKMQDGLQFHQSAMDDAGPTGKFIRSCFNPKDNTKTYYYFDFATLRWIIAVEPYNTANDINLASIIFSSRDNGAGYVFKWLPFMSRTMV